MKSMPLRGEVWRVDFEPVQGRVRPALIVSNNILNRSAAQMVTVVPIATKSRPIRSFLKIDPPQGGLPQTSYVICDQVRTISTGRLGKKFGTVSPTVQAEVDRRLRFLLDLG